MVACQGHKSCAGRILSAGQARAGGLQYIRVEHVEPTLSYEYLFTEARTPYQFLGNSVQDRVTSKSREEISTKISIWVLMRKVLRFLSARFSQSKVVQGVILEKLHDPDASHCSPGCLTYRSCRHMIMLAEACCRDRFAGYRRSAPAP